MGEDCQLLELVYPEVYQPNPGTLVADPAIGQMKAQAGASKKSLVASALVVPQYK